MHAQNSITYIPRINFVSVENRLWMTRKFQDARIYVYITSSGYLILAQVAFLTGMILRDL